VDPLEEEAARRARLRAWVMDEPLPEQAASSDYARYRDLLPQVLAGIVPPGSADDAWFQAYLDECDACREEYDALRAALAAERAARATPGGPTPAYPAYNLGFLPPAPAPAGRDQRAVAWAMTLAADAVLRQTSSGPHVEVRFRPPPGPPPALPERRIAGVAEPDADPWKLLLTRVFYPAEDLPEVYTLSVAAERLDATTCRLQITLDSPALGPSAAGIPIVVQSLGAAPFTVRTDAAGQAQATLPIAALPGLTLDIPFTPG
jgi:hypothetical protein